MSTPPDLAAELQQAKADLADAVRRRCHADVLHLADLCSDLQQRLSLHTPATAPTDRG